MEIREIKALLLLMQEYGLTELEIDDKKKGKVRLVRSATTNEVSPSRQASAIGRPHAPLTRHLSAEVGKTGSTDSQPAISEKQQLVTSPMVGTFYRASAPDAPSFVEEGDSVRKGQTVCIIEAMKMMNEIEAETAGRVVKILCENAHAVEYGQTLMLLEVE
jgi:acetyl-CoA carboxylase biotin carboxyl carrier protein